MPLCLPFWTAESKLSLFVSHTYRSMKGRLGLYFPGYLSHSSFLLFVPLAQNSFPLTLYVMHFPGLFWTLSIFFRRAMSPGPQVFSPSKSGSPSPLDRRVSQGCLDFLFLFSSSNFPLSFPFPLIRLLYSPFSLARPLRADCLLTSSLPPCWFGYLPRCESSSVVLLAQRFLGPADFSFDFFCLSRLAS